jgi:hypothetical protein
MNVSDVVEAVRGKARHLNIQPDRISADTAIRILDDWARTQPRSKIARWYDKASDRTLDKFERLWRRWQRGRQGEAIDRPRNYYWIITETRPGRRGKTYRYTNRRKAIASARELAFDKPELHSILIVPGNQDDPDRKAEVIYRAR